MFRGLRISHVEFDFQARRNQGRAGMVEWNGIFWLFRFSRILGQTREVHPKFRNEIPENDCSFRSPTRNVRNFWSNGRRPQSLSPPPPLYMPATQTILLQEEIKNRRKKQTCKQKNRKESEGCRPILSSCIIFCWIPLQHMHAAILKSYLKF